MTTDLTGKTLGNYRIHRRLGKGGMGEVYLAHDLPLDRPVALKVMLSKWSHDPSIVERFHREARAAARLNHPNIVQIYTVGIEADVPYFAMEFVHGMPLDRLLKSQGPMPWQRALQIIGQVASALDAAHTKGIIHRDIKPANILIDKQGRARVTDFGVAKVLTASTQLTTDGSYIGTPQYMSPEQCGVGEMCPASDLFSLGVTAYELLAGTTPFEGDTPATLIKRITQDPPRPLSEMAVGLPAGVCALVETMLEKDLARRYKSAREVMAEISRILASGGIDPMQDRPTTPVISKPPTKALTILSGKNLAIAGAVLALLVGTFLVAAHRARIKRDATPTAAPLANADTDSSEEEILASDPHQVFLERDADKNGKLDESEVPISARPLFLRADTNNDHAVDMDEYKLLRQRLKDRSAAGPKRLGPLAPKGPQALTPDEIMTMMDKNHDGFVTPEEIPPQFPNLLRAADANRDGRLTAREIQESRRPKR